MLNILRVQSKDLYIGMFVSALDRPWLGPVISASRRAEMHELWTALAEFGAGQCTLTRN